MALTKKYADVYDNVKHLTPMTRMLREQAAKQKLEDEKNKEEVEDGNTNTDDGKPRAKSRAVK